jgi:septum site-determining protein MinD
VDFPIAFCAKFLYNEKNCTGRGGFVGELIAFLSGKGGTGKTSLCAGIAAALAASGESVLCIDCDVGLRNLDIALGMTDSGTMSFLEVCRGEYDFSQIPCHPQFPKLAFLTAPVNCLAEEIGLREFAAMLRSARNHFRYVLLDAPAGLDAGFRLCAANADRCLLVTNSEPAAVRDASRVGQQLEAMGKTDVRLLVNRVNKKMFGTMDVTVDDVMDRAGLPLLGIVPEDSNVSLAAVFEKSLLLYTKKGAAAACRRIAKRIQGLPEPMKLRKI